MHPNTFLRMVQEEAGLRGLDDARIATRIVFNLLHHRILPGEAKDVQAQLPAELAEIWEGGEVWTERLLARFTPQNRFNRKEFIEMVEAEKTDLPATGEQITRAVFYALQSQIMPGEAEDVAVQLPQDLRELWEESRPLARPMGGAAPVSELSATTDGSPIS